MKQKTLVLLCLVICTLTAQIQLVQAWGMTGHRVIAEIAEHHLNKKTKRNIAAIIGQQKLAYWSNWADFIKSDPDPVLNKTGSWHFVNTNADLSFGQFVEELKLSSEDNLYKAYLQIKEHAANDQQSSLTQRQYNLYYLIHLYADAHQPMHVSREEDQGGNKIEVNFFGRKTNIHRVWDSELIDNEKYSFMEYASVLDIYKGSSYLKYTDCSFEEVLFQSHELANKIYKDVAYNANLSYRYIYDYKYIMEECLLKAGVRLAAELNAVYGK